LSYTDCESRGEREETIEKESSRRREREKEPERKERRNERPMALFVSVHARVCFHVPL